MALIAGVGAFIATLGGVAVATDTLPGPLRVVAFDLGLPISSPALVTAKADLENLRAALTQHNVPAVREAALVLRHDLAKVPPDDRQEVQPAAEVLLTESDDLLGTDGTGRGGPASGGSAETPSTSVPDDSGGSTTETDQGTTPNVPNPPGASAPEASTPPDTSESTTTTSTTVPGPATSPDTSDSATTSGDNSTSGAT